MNGLSFSTSEKTAPFFERIAQTMMDSFGVDRREALDRMNRHWKGQSIVDEDDVLFHEDETFWAFTVYYGAHSRWWLGTEGLRPLPLDDIGS